MNMSSSTLLKRKRLSPTDLERLAAKNPDEMRDIAAKLCRDFLPGAWKTISINDLKLKRISGGLSNFLYHVSLPDNVTCSTGINSPIPMETNTNFKRPRRESMEPIPKEVLLRIYGQVHGEQTPDSLITDNIVFALLSERKLGPKLHGIFPGGRIEQYIPARALLTTELSVPSISCKIAEKMATIHSLDIPISKEPDWLWNTMERWLKNVDSILKQFDEKQLSCNGYKVKVIDIDFRKEADWLRQEIENRDFPVVFSHNDMQEGNILLREDSFCMISEDETTRSDFSSDDSMPLDSKFNDIYLNGENNSDIGDHELSSPVDRLRRKRSFSGVDEVESSNSVNDSVLGDHSLDADNHVMRSENPEIMIIDFEYCAYNYRSFDLANHFIEWTIDYTNPSYPYFYHFNDYYPSREQQIRFITTYLQNLLGDDDYQPPVDEIDEIIEEIEIMTMASHLFWSLWSFVNLLQEIEFGYLEYGHFRLSEYLSLKEAFMQKYQNKNEKRGAK